jgi:hypothetical protein
MIGNSQSISVIDVFFSYGKLTKIAAMKSNIQETPKHKLMIVRLDINETAPLLCCLS